MALSPLLACHAIRSSGAMSDVDRLHVPSNFITMPTVNARPRRNVQGVHVADDVARKGDALSTIKLMRFL